MNEVELSAVAFDVKTRAGIGRPSENFEVVVDREATENNGKIAFSVRVPEAHKDFLYQVQTLSEKPTLNTQITTENGQAKLVALVDVERLPREYEMPAADKDEVTRIAAWVNSVGAKKDEPGSSFPFIRQTPEQYRTLTHQISVEQPEDFPLVKTVIAKVNSLTGKTIDGYSAMALINEIQKAQHGISKT